MDGANRRKFSRYDVGGLTDFETNLNTHLGHIVNTGLGGVLISLDIENNKIKVGDIHDIFIYDIFFDKKYIFSSKIVRKSDKEIAFEFMDPLTEEQLACLQEWFYMGS